MLAVTGIPNLYRFVDGRAGKSLNGAPNTLMSDGFIELNNCCRADYIGM
jgi:hypothetical protein